METYSANPIRSSRAMRVQARHHPCRMRQPQGNDYDGRGRVWPRRDFMGADCTAQESQSAWAYDVASGSGIGALAEESNGWVRRTLSHDALGRIRSKDGMGTNYVYGVKPAVCSGDGSPSPYVTPGPNAVSEAGTAYLCYDANGNLRKQVNRSTGSVERTLAYTAADQVETTKDTTRNAKVGFGYGPNRERLRRLDYAGAEAVGADTVVHWVGGAQVRYTASVVGGVNQLVDVRRMAGNTMVTQRGSGPGYSLKRQVVLRDRQGSIDQVLGAMTLEPVNASSPSSFDAWGERRDTATWSTPKPWDWSLEHLLQASTTQGYTGHEMAESVGIIHMNGRIYDPQLGRFLQADPFVQSPGDLQSWNRYSYGFNNPLYYTDPSGYISWGEVIKIAVVSVFAYATGGWAGGMYAAGNTAAAYGVAVAGGATIGAMQTGTLRGAAAGALSSGIFFGIGSYYQGADWAQAGEWENAMGSGLSWSGYAAKTLSHGMAGGVMSELQGGNFGHGFASAGFGEAATPLVGGIRSVPLQAVAIAVVGGTASRLAGGKFANGAVTASFGFAFNQMAHGGRSHQEEANELALEVSSGGGPPTVWPRGDSNG